MINGLRYFRKAAWDILNSNERRMRYDYKRRGLEFTD